MRNCFGIVFLRVVLGLSGSFLGKPRGEMQVSFGFFSRCFFCLGVVLGLSRETGGDMQVSCWLDTKNVHFCFLCVRVFMYVYVCVYVKEYVHSMCLVFSVVFFVCSFNVCIFSYICNLSI